MTFAEMPPEYPDDLMALKTPPASIEAEQAVLGGVMVDRASWGRLEAILTPSDFYRPEHRIIFAAMEALAADDQPIDPITLADHMQRSGELERVGGLGYLAQISATTPSAANIRAYAKAVRDRALLRRLIEAGQEIADKGWEPAGKQVGALIDEAQSLVLAIEQEGRGEEDIPTTNSALRDVVDEIDRLYNSEQELTGLPTGINSLDRRLMGLQNGDLIILAARPSMGKTTLAMNIAEHNIELGNTVLVFSMEMPRNQLIKKCISSLGRIPFEHVRSGKLHDSEWPGLSAAVSKLKDSPLIIDDRNGLSVAQMRTTARRIHRKTPLKMIIVDYLQIIGLGGKRRSSRNEDITEISAALKSLARELGIPLIALSQLNRELEKRTNKRPINSDLRDSGTIEQDADVILFIYRDEVYNEDSPEKGIAEIICRKQRLGPVGTEYASALLQYSRFENLSVEYRPQTETTTKKGSGRFNYE